MKLGTSLLLAVGLAGTAAPAAAAPRLCWELEQVNVPDGQGGDLYTSWYGINDHGQIVGNHCIDPYCAPTPSGAIVGAAIHDLNTGRFERFELPAPYNWVGSVSINDRGDVVGQASTIDLATFTFTTVHGFWRHPDGRLEILPAIRPDVVQYSANAINNRGDIVGSFVDPLTGNYRAFILSGGQYRPYDAVPAPGGTILTDISDQGRLLGYTLDAAGQVDGTFLDEGAGPVFLQLPPAAETRPTGLNDRGMVVGTTRINPGDLDVGWVSTAFGIVTIVHPGAADTYVADINNRGVLVGTIDFASWGLVGRPGVCRN